MLSLKSTLQQAATALAVVGIAVSASAPRITLAAGGSEDNGEISRQEWIESIHAGG